MDYNSLNDFGDLKFAISDLHDLFKSIDCKVEDMEYKMGLLQSKLDYFEDRLVKVEGFYKNKAE